MRHGCSLISRFQKNEKLGRVGVGCHSFVVQTAWKNPIQDPLNVEAKGDEQMAKMRAKLFNLISHRLTAAICSSVEGIKLLSLCQPEKKLRIVIKFPLALSSRFEVSLRCGCTIDSSCRRARRNYGYDECRKNKSGRKKRRHKLSSIERE